MLYRNLSDPPNRQRRAKPFQAVAAVALDPSLDEQKEIGPDRLRTSEAAPYPAGKRIRQNEDCGGQDPKPVT